MQFDPQIYEGAPVVEQDVPVAAKVPVDTSGEVTPIASSLQPLQAYQQGDAERQETIRPKATIGASMAASTSQWMTTSIYRAFTDPIYPPDDSKASDMIQESGLTLNNEEMDYISDSKSAPQRRLRIDRVRDLQDQGKIMQDHPVASFVAQVGDPVALIIGPAVASAGITTAAVRAAMGVALGAAGQAANVYTRPTSKLEIVLGTVLEGVGAASMKPKAGVTKKVATSVGEVEIPHMILKDPEYPAGALQEIAHTTKAAAIRNPDAEAAALDMTQYHTAETARNVMEEYLKTQDTGLHGLAKTFSESVYSTAIKSRLVSLTDTLPESVLQQFKRGAAAVTAVSDSGVVMYFRKDIPDAFRGDVLVHETAHALTIAAMKRRPELAAELLSIGRKVTNHLSASVGFSHNPAKTQLLNFWKQVATKDADEVLAYAVTSPKFREVMSKLDESGAVLGDAPAVLDAPKPLTLWDKIKDLYYRLVGGKTAQATFDYQLEQHLDSAKNAKAYLAKGSMAKKLDNILTELLHDTEQKGMYLDEVEYPEGLTPGIMHEQTAVYKAVNEVLEKEATLAGKWGKKIEWNFHSRMARFGSVHADIADILIDNQGKYNLTSVESHTRAVSAQMKPLLGRADNLILEAMAEDGFGTFKRIWNNAEASAHQAKLEYDVSMEMHRRQQAIAQGRTINHTSISKRVKDIADAYDVVAKQMLDEMQFAEVKGAENLQHTSGWLSRRWDSLKVQQIIDRVGSALSIDAKAARVEVVNTLARSIADANPKFDWELAHDLAGSTIDRALRKGMFEDSAMSVSQGADAAKRIRDMLVDQGLPYQRIQRVMDVLVGVSDEASKAGFLKHRIDLDYTTSLDLGNTGSFNVTDMLDHNVKGIMDDYVNKACSQVGFARKGLKSASDIDGMRTKGIEALKGDVAAQEDFVELFDGTVKSMQGLPVGEKATEFMRNMSVFNRLISLAAAGFWQLTEYAKMMQQYGMLKTVKYMMAEFGPFKHMMDTGVVDKAMSAQLKDILQTATADSLRLQPFVKRFSDGFEIPKHATLTGKLQHAGQLVPYLNGMRWVHAHQARVMANLVSDTVRDAAMGNTKAAIQLQKYGITAEHLATLKADVKVHGLDVGKWSDGNWENIRPAFLKMADEAVLHERLGDIAPWVKLSSVGKFVGTYRGFVFTAHNKLLAGGLQRDGFAGIGLMMAYQYPLTAIAVQANATLNNKKKMTPEQLSVAAMTQMGSMGFISEVAPLILNPMIGLPTKAYGTMPAMIPVDRVAGALSEIGKTVTGRGDPSKLAHSLFQITPALAVLAPARAFEGWANPQGK